MALVARQVQGGHRGSRDRTPSPSTAPGQLFTEESYTANKLFKAGIRTNNVDGNPRLCMASAATGYIQVYGKDEPPGCYEDIDHADCFFLIGANPFECHPPLFERIQRRRRTHPGTHAHLSSIRAARRTAEHADLHLAPGPGHRPAAAQRDGPGDLRTRAGSTRLSSTSTSASATARRPSISPRSRRS